MRMRWSRVLITGSMVATMALGGAALAPPTASSTTGDRGTGSAPGAALPADVASAVGDLPLAFVPNRGQTDPRVRYYAVGHRFAFFATRDELMLSLSKGKPARHLALALRFLNRSPDAVVRRSGRRRARSTTSPAGTRLPARPGCRSTARSSTATSGRGSTCGCAKRAGVLKYEFHVRPGGRVSDIRLAYAGARRLALGAGGALRIRTALGVLRDSAAGHLPEDRRHASAGVEPLPTRGRGQRARFAFNVGRHQRGHELVIDPGVQFTTFLGGNSNETGAGIAVDASGNSYIGGTTQSPNFPTTTGAFDRTGAASNFADAFVTKLNPAGTALVYSTYVGGSNMEFGNGIAVDAAGNAYVTGTTKSTNFPTTGGAFDRSLNTPGNCPRCGIDNTDGFVFKLNAAGSALTLLDLSRRWHRHRLTARHRGGRRRQRVRRRRDAVERLPDDGGGVPPDQVGPDRHVRHEAEPDRVGARVLDLPRWRAGRQRPERHRRLRGQRLRRRGLELGRLPDHGRGLRPDGERRRSTPPSRS